MKIYMKDARRKVDVNTLRCTAAKSRAAPAPMLTEAVPVAVAMAPVAEAAPEPAVSK